MSVGDDQKADSESDGEESAGSASAHAAIRIDDGARWGDVPVLIGEINGLSVEVPVPLNDLAVRTMPIESAIALALTRRIQELEKEIAALKRRVNYQD